MSDLPPSDSTAAPAGSDAAAATARSFPRGPDRRQRPTARVSRFALTGGRRRHARRSEEQEGSFIDLYGWRTWALLFWVALMNVLDSVFTLTHLQAGGIELNPVADAMLGLGRMGFTFLKSILIALPLLVLAIHKNFFLARIGLWTATGAYTALFVYHLLLFRLG
jgi:hypothetical protein